MTLQSDSKAELPFIFTYRDFVYGSTGLVTEVNARGRVLAVQEDEGWWMYGVNPGDISACGKTLADAHTQFRKAFTAILYDIADDVVGFEAFSTHVKSFFNQVNKPVSVAWQEAVAVVRKNTLAEGGQLPQETLLSVGEIPRLPAETPVSIEVALRRKFSNKLNVFEPEPALAA